MSRTRYSTVAIVLHWLIAAAIIFQVILAWRMDGRTPQGFALIQLHKSVGLSILLFSLARLAWRLTHRPPPLPESLASWERSLAKITHIGLYVIMIGMPITGWIMVSTSRIQVPTLLYGLVPWPHVPGLAHLTGAAKTAWNSFGHTGHEALAWGAYLLIALHVAGALKHQLFSRDEPILAHMAPGAKPGRWMDPWLIAIVVVALGVAAAAQIIQPAIPMSKPLPAPPAAAPAPLVEASTAPPALQTAETPPAAPAADAPAGASAWTVNQGSTLGFATSWGGQVIEGRFDRWTADIVFGPEALDKSKVSVSVDLGSAVSGDSQRDESLKGGDWFDTVNYAKATFTATRFEKTGPDRYIAHGQLTLRGVSKPARLPFRLQIEGDKARVSGVTTLDRTAFGVGQGEWTKTDQIPADVKVSVNLTATRR